MWPRTNLDAVVSQRTPRALKRERARLEPALHVRAARLCSPRMLDGDRIFRQQTNTTCLLGPEIFDDPSIHPEYVYILVTVRAHISVEEQVFSIWCHTR